MPNDVRPYLVPRPGTVNWEPWELFDTDWVALPDEFDGWDTGTDLAIRRLLRVDVERFRHETGLDLQQVVVTVSWTSSTTGMKGAAPPVRIQQNGMALLEATLPGERISGTVDIRTTLCLAQRSNSALPVVARLPGSVLADHRQSVVLERGSQLFPVDEIDFAGTRLPPEASWHLETGVDLTSPFFGSFRVLINKRDTELSQAVARGARDKRQQALLEELEAGVSALLLELAVLLQDELAEPDEWPADSVGDVLMRTLKASPLAGVPAPSAGDLAVFRTRVAAAVRRNGQGRLLR